MPFGRRLKKQYGGHLLRRVHGFPQRYKGKQMAKRIKTMTFESSAKARDAILAAISAGKSTSEEIESIQKPMASPSGMDLIDSLNEATDEIAEVLADLDLSDSELLEIRGKIKERLEQAQIKLLEIAQHYKT